MKFRVFLKLVLTTFFVTGLIFLGDKDDVLPKLQKDGYIFTSFDLTYLRLSLFGLGTLLSCLLLAMPLYYAEKKIVDNERTLQEIMTFNKKIFVDLFVDHIKEKHANINIRVLVSCRKKWQKFCEKIKLLEQKEVFRVIDIPGLTDDLLKKDLLFEVHPKCEGLVGKVFCEEKMVIDFDIKNSGNVYMLTNYQKEETSHLTFCAAFPIFDSKNKVVAIVSFDSKDKMTLNNSKEESLTSTMRNYAKFLHLHFSLLTKIKI